MKRILLTIRKTMLNIIWKMLNSIALWRFKNTSFKPSINGKIKTIGHGRVVFGEGVRINSSFSSNPIGGMERTILNVEKDALLEIGDKTGISNVAIVCKKHIKIGKNVRIGGNTYIYDTDFHSLDLEKRISANDDDIKCKEVIVKDGAFIGAHCIILKGVTIGENSIVGAGSVVTKDIPDNEIWAGNPVRFIRKI